MQILTFIYWKRSRSSVEGRRTYVASWQRSRRALETNTATEPSLAGANADKYRQWFAITRGSPSCDQCPGPVHASGGGEGLGEASEANATAPDLVTDQAETATSAEDHRRYIAAFAAASESGYQKELLIEQENNAALQGIVQRQWSAMDGIYTESVKDTDSLRALCKDLLNVTKALGPKHTPTTPETAKLAEIAQDLMTVVERQRNMRDCLMKAKHSDMKEAGVAHSDMRYNEG